MSATDELRALLDERGVEWWEEYGFIYWKNRFGYSCNCATGHESGMVSVLFDAKPEQAVEATLGRGTCEVVRSIRHDYEGGYGGTEYEHELSCGHKTWWADDDPPEWCPHCGRKVVDA